MWNLDIGCPQEKVTHAAVWYIQYIATIHFRHGQMIAGRTAAATLRQLYLLTTGRFVTVTLPGPSPGHGTSGSSQQCCPENIIIIMIMDNDIL